MIRALKDQGVRHIFGYPGGAVLPIYDALFADNEIIHVLCRHEQGAVHAAEGYARSTGKPGVVLVTSGPGATNAVTGITDALMDSIPLVVLTGQVPTHLIAMTRLRNVTRWHHAPLHQHNWLVKDAKSGAHAARSLQIATAGRPGPVVVDIPKVQFNKGNMLRRVRCSPHAPQDRPDLAQIVQAIDLMAMRNAGVLYRRRHMLPDRSQRAARAC